MAVNFRGFCFVVVIVGVFAFLLAVVVENFAKKATKKGERGGERDREERYYSGAMSRNITQQMRC